LLVIVGNDQEVKNFILDRLQGHGDNNHQAVIKQLKVPSSIAA
jgi:hypothetical protein